RGFLTRQENGRKHIYAPAQAQDETQSDLLDNFLQKAFGGSAMKLVMKTLGNYYKTNDGELDKLKQMIEHIEQKEDNQTPDA
ncbi:MAG: BlaI/MecI/CopY family transcriptional regulator, partial [Bacteroidota bacterium]